MDGKQILEAAEYCKSIDEGLDESYACRRCFDKYDECAIKVMDENTIIAVRDHVKTEERAKERAEVIGKVRYRVQLRLNSLHEANNNPYYRMCLADVEAMLDELEQEVPNE